MLKRLLVVPLVVLVAFALGARGAEASVIDLDATLNDSFSPASLFLLPGDYTITPVGALFEAWSKWDGSSCDGEGHCTQGFENSYAFFASDIPVIHIWDGQLYQYAFQALDHAIGYAFTIVNPEFVKFYIEDTPLGDNRGGMSLDVAAIPEPATLMLLATGLAAVGRRRFRLSRRP